MTTTHPNAGPTAGDLQSGIPEESHPPAKSKGAPVPNVGPRERWMSLAGGAALVLWGLTRRKPLGLLVAGAGVSMVRRGWTRHCPLYEALGVSTVEHNEATAVPARQGYRVERAVTIARPVDEIYAQWSDLENLPHIMRHLRRVEKITDSRSRWTAEGPLGTQLEWDAETLVDRENGVISWRSVEGSQVETAGSVRFTALPHDRGTVVRVNMKYDPPAGKVGATLAKLLGGGLKKQLTDDLAAFKSRLEAGEAPTTRGQPRGSR